LVDEHSIFEAVAARRIVVAQAAAKTKSARRELARRVQLRSARGGAAAKGSTDEDAGEPALVPMPTEADRGSVEEWS
jgi:hypothetical protein